MTEAALEHLKGAERAAVVLFLLGEDAAAEVLKHMGARDVQKLGATMANMHDVSEQHRSAALTQFMDAVGRPSAGSFDSENFIRGVLVKALGDDKAGSLMDRILLDRILLRSKSKGLATLKWMDARSIADIVRNEHPQMVAIVLAYLEREHAADVLALLPEQLRVDVVLRVATLDKVQSGALQELNEILETQVTGDVGSQASTVGGVKTAADILNFLDSSIESEVMEKVTELEPDMGQAIESLMFVFENLLEVDDKSVQALLREVSSDLLVIALKGAGEQMKEKIFKNMSKRGVDMLRDDLEVKGPVRVSEVEAAQKEILAVARRMAEEGTISLGDHGGEEFV